MTRATTPESVLDFWFGEPAEADAGLMAKIRRWFVGGPGMDREVTERFGPTVEAALDGALDAWATTARGRLALVIVLDQFTRNVYRGDPRTYAGDSRAQRLALEAFDQGLDRGLSYVERLFLSMPLLHSEDLGLHGRLGEIVREGSASAPPEYRVMAAMNVEQAEKYASIIARFGRFPHRNAILGRETTPEEASFLVDWAENARPKGMREEE